MCLQNVSTCYYYEIEFMQNLFVFNYYNLCAYKI